MFTSPFPDVEIPATSIYDDLFGDLSADDAARIALIDPATGAETTYGALKAQVDAFAGALAARAVGTDTVVGSVSAQFAGIAPGVQVSPRVKPSITDLVASGNLDAASLDVSPQERTRVITEAAVGVGLRFAAGGVLGLLLCLGVVRLRRRTLPHRRTVLGASLVTAVTLSTLGLSAWRTYDPDRLVELRSSGLLQLAIANRDLLDDVEQRADQATPYLRNLLALSTAMQQEYAPEAEDDTAALKVLLVSDVHASNQYALMRTIVREQDIDVVIDSGDLINFGRVQEAGLSNLYRSISSLGVP